MKLSKDELELVQYALDFYYRKSKLRLPQSFLKVTLMLRDRVDKELSQPESKKQPQS